MPILGADQILNQDDIKVQVVDVPEWGEGAKVYVKVLSGKQRDQLEGSFIDKKGDPSRTENLRARLLVLAMCDEQGRALFHEGQVGALGMKSGVALNRVFEAAKDLNKIFGAEDVGQVEKNSESGQSESSGFTSQPESITAQ